MALLIFTASWGGLMRGGTAAEQPKLLAAGFHGLFLLRFDRRNRCCQQIIVVIFSL